MLRNGLAVIAGADFSLVAFFLAVQAFVIDRQDDLTDRELLFDQVKRGGFRHFLHDDPCFFEIVGLHQHLSRRKAPGFGLIAFDQVHCARFPAPCVVDQELRVDAEGLIEDVFTANAASCDVAHCPYPHVLKLCRIAAADSPEVRERPVVPELITVAHFIQLRNAYAVFIRRRFFGHDVHRDLGEIEVGADAGRGGDAGFVENVADHLHCQLPCCQVIGVQIGGGVDQHLIDRIDVNVFGRNVAQVDLVDPRAVLHVERHAGRCGDIRQFEPCIGLELADVCGFSGEVRCGFSYGFFGEYLCGFPCCASRIAAADGVCGSVAFAAFFLQSS